MNWVRILAVVAVGAVGFALFWPELGSAAAPLWGGGKEKTSVEDLREELEVVRADLAELQDEFDVHRAHYREALRRGTEYSERLERDVSSLEAENDNLGSSYRGLLNQILEEDDASSSSDRRRGR